MFAVSPAHILYISANLYADFSVLLSTIYYRGRPSVSSRDTNYFQSSETGMLIHKISILLYFCDTSVVLIL